MSRLWKDRATATCCAVLQALARLATPESHTAIERAGGHPWKLVTVAAPEQLDGPRTGHRMEPLGWKEMSTVTDEHEPRSDPPRRIRPQPAAASEPTRVLARHGETELNVPGVEELNATKRFRGRVDPPLTSKGARQARALADALIGLGPAALYTSPRTRAVATCAPLRQGLGLEPIVNPALDDFDYGTWTGKTAGEAEHGWPTVLAQWRSDPGGVQFPEGETVAGARARFETFLEHVRRTHPRETVVAVTHDAIIRIAVCAVLDVPLSAYHRIQIELGHTTGIVVGAQLRLLWLNRLAA